MEARREGSPVDLPAPDHPRPGRCPTPPALVPQLAALGADWVYLSPILESDEGSDHGYDVTDHGTTDTARGGREGLAAVADAAHAAGMGVLVDIVPNHVGVATPAALDLVVGAAARRPGIQSTPAAFDVDWDAGGGRIRLPVLGDGADELDRLELIDDEIAYYDKPFPDRPGHGGRVGARGARPPALRAGELPARRRGTQLPAVLRGEHASPASGWRTRTSSPPRIAEVGELGGPGLGRRPAHRPPGRAGRPGRVSRRPRGADRSPLRGGGEDPRGRGDAARVLAVRRHLRLRRARRWSTGCSSTRRGQAAPRRARHRAARRACEWTGPP